MYMHTHMHMHTRMHVHTHAHTCTCTHTCTHTMVKYKCNPPPHPTIIRTVPVVKVSLSLSQGGIFGVEGVWLAPCGLL